VIGKSTAAPLAIGAALMIMVYAGGPISGGHYNPAVSLAALLRKALPFSDFFPYVAAQLLGAVVASLAVLTITGESFAPAPSAGTSTISAVLVELLFTFALAYVVLNVAVEKKVAGNSYFGLAIGFTVVVAAYAGGGISGGAFNPAVGIGPTIVHATMGGGNWSSVWLYIVAPFAGAALAAGVSIMQAEGQLRDVGVANSQ
jgi:aquaporin Z